MHNLLGKFVKTFSGPRDLIWAGIAKSNDKNTGAYFKLRNKTQTAAVTDLNLT